MLGSRNIPEAQKNMLNCTTIKQLTTLKDNHRQMSTDHKFIALDILKGRVI